MPLRSLLLTVLVAAAATTGALAEEKPVPLKEAPGHDLVESNCGSCHSLDYIRMNSPFMTGKAWEAEVKKMINAFGAPIEPADAKTIIEYLTRNYGSPG